MDRHSSRIKHNPTNLSKCLGQCQKMRKIGTLFLSYLNCGLGLLQVMKLTIKNLRRNMLYGKQIVRTLLLITMQLIRGVHKIKIFYYAHVKHSSHNQVKIIFLSFALKRVLIQKDEKTILKMKNCFWHHIICSLRKISIFKLFLGESKESKAFFRNNSI